MTDAMELYAKADRVSEAIDNTGGLNDYGRMCLQDDFAEIWNMARDSLRYSHAKKEIRRKMRSENYVNVGELMKRLDEVLDEVLPE